MKFKQKLIWCKGLPGSTKSTWARQYQKEHGTDKVKIVDKDSIREMLDQSEWSKANEKLVLQIEDEIILKSLIAGYSVVVHDTNFGDKHPERFKNLATIAGVEVECQDFTHVPLETCIANDLKRNRSVGEAVIRKMWKQFLAKNTPTNERDPIYREQNESLPKALLVDLDGTIALIGHRGPYDASRCIDDKLNKPVKELIDSYIKSGKIDLIVFCSGREDKHFEMTKKWLDLVGGFDSFPYELYMRKTSDFRKDYIVKKELFEVNIDGKYNILAVVDDRKSVCQMWRDELNLPVFQCAEGDF